MEKDEVTNKKEHVAEEGSEVATLLTPYQREMLRKHVYKSEGCSITEKLVLKHFWNWLTARFPLWLAPNTITMLGLAITFCTTLSIILLDLNCEGKVSVF